jgi:cellulose synthase/poly-beta-1,6-N-acetylglucosamine synthase-like glycosyltransferase
MLSTAVCLAFLLPASAVCLAYLLYNSVGILSRVSTRPGRGLQRSFTVLIPAHNEEATLGRALQSLANQDYPREKLRVLVVADNCTDGTGEVAKHHGADCLFRTDLVRRGKGFAIAAGMGAIGDADVVLILDADCELNPQAIAELNTAFDRGAKVVQSAVISRNADAGAAGYVAAVGAAFDRAVSAGRGRLGRAVPLRGTGMAFSRDVIPLVKWETASPVEDAEYDRQLRSAGVRVSFCKSAEVFCEAPATLADFCHQRRRWAVAGVFQSKPMTLALTGAAAVLCFFCGEFVPWAATLLLVTAALYLRAMAEVGLTSRRLGLLLRTPAVILRMLHVALTPRRSVLWQRTPRVGEPA